MEMSDSKNNIFVYSAETVTSRKAANGQKQEKDCGEQDCTQTVFSVSDTNLYKSAQK